MAQSRASLLGAVLLGATLVHASGFDGTSRQTDEAYRAEIEYLTVELQKNVPFSPKLAQSQRKTKRSTTIIERSGNSVETHDCGQVTTVPGELRLPVNMFPSGLDEFYQKYTQAYGIPVLGSENVTDTALKRACYMMRVLLADRPDIRETFYKMFGRFALMAPHEMTTDIPEHSHMTPKDYWDARTRGLGATRHRPVSTGGEENVVCLKQDRYPKEDIPLHEFAHAIHLIAANYAIHGFDSRLKSTYKSAKLKGLWANTYAMTNSREYWAEAVQSYFNEDDIAIPINGIHNHIHTRAGLRKYDPDVFALCQEIWPCENEYRLRCMSTRELEQQQVLKMNCNGTNNTIFSYNPDCRDKHYECPYWASIGECAKNPNYMLKVCLRSCRQCTTKYNGQANENVPSDVEPMTMCQDTDGNCTYSTCKKNITFSIEHCRSTCVNCAYYIDLLRKGAYNDSDADTTTERTTTDLGPWLSGGPSNATTNIAAVLCLIFIKILMVGQ